MNKLKNNLLFLCFTLVLFSAKAQEKNTQNDSIAKVTFDVNATDSIAKIIQDTVPKKPQLSKELFNKTKTYVLGGINVKGNEQFSDQSITVFSELVVGQPIKIPGDKLTSAIKKLWNSKLFSNVEVYATQIDGETIYLEFAVKELSKLSSVTIQGVKKNRAEEFKNDTEFKEGEMLTENLLTTTKNYIAKEYIDRGFLKANVNIDTKIDTSNNNSQKALITINKGEKIKIKNLRFSGNKAFKTKRLKKLLKKTNSA